MVRGTAICAIVGALIFCSAGAARSVTCDECQELEKNKAVTQQDLIRKEKDLEASFKKKEFRKVTEIRSQITDLRKKLMEIQDKSKDCKDACKPDVIKEAECKKLRSEITMLESASSDADADTEQAEKVDTLYRDLRKCNKELQELRKGSK